MQEGGRHPVDGCQDGDGFGGADFQYLAANVIDEGSGESLLPPYEIRSFDGVKVGFIGLTLEGTPEIVTPSGSRVSSSPTRPTPPMSSCNVYATARAFGHSWF
jgi:hypothetical protein